MAVLASFRRSPRVSYRVPRRCVCVVFALNRVLSTVIRLRLGELLVNRLQVVKRTINNTPLIP